jgi:hypothetical protein
MDIETYTDNGELVPYAIGYTLDGEKCNIFTKLKDGDDFILKCFNSLMIKKYDA